VRIWSTQANRGKTGTTYSVRWKVGRRRHHKTFATAKLAESFRSDLVVASRRGEPFDERSGLPAALAPTTVPVTWYRHACAFVDLKWPHASPRHRKGIAEGLITATIASAMRSPGAPSGDLERRALLRWAFNTSARRGLSIDRAVCPEEFVETLRWLDNNTPTLDEIARPAILRPVLDALALRLDGSPASASTVARKRSAVHSALAYAVELEFLATHPMDRIHSPRAQHTDVVDRRVVVNPQQAASLLQAVRTIHPSLEAYFACLYYAGLRPAEARHLRESNIRLPEAGWGSLHLEGSTPTAGGEWTDSGKSDEDRQLKHRTRKDTREVPASPELVAILRRHLARFPSGPDGRIFVTRTGRAGTPLAGPYATPQSMGIVYRVWDQARREYLSPLLYSSPLARRPYDLRHAAVSLWLNAGVPATQVAEWAGHSVNVLLRVYAKCIYGQDEAAKQRVQAALESAGSLGRDG
jgi:integrase